MSITRPSMKELAEQITQHLRRFEADPVINSHKDPRLTGLHPYYSAGTTAAGKFVFVTYITYQGHRHLTRKEAEEYLAWLDAGNVDKYFEMRT